MPALEYRQFIHSSLSTVEVLIMHKPKLKISRHGRVNLKVCLGVSTIESNQDRDVLTCQDFLGSRDVGFCNVEISTKIEISRHFRVIETWVLKCRDVGF
jgi:hypothetical protein